MKMLSNKTFWRLYRIANLVPKPEDAIECQGEEGLQNVGELQQTELSAARIDFWKYSMNELEDMYRKLFGFWPTRMSKERLVECLITGRLY